MTWFSHPNIDISEDDLIAYHLHELPPRRERAVARALAASATLAASSAAVETTLRTLKDTPHPIDQAAFTRAWAALQPALLPYPEPPATPPRWRTPALAATTAALLAAAATAVFTLAHLNPASYREIAPASTAAANPTSASQSVAHIATGAPNPPPPTSPSANARLVRPSLTDDFSGKVNAGIYHPTESKQPSPVHPLALAPTTGPDPTIADAFSRFAWQSPSTALPTATATATQQPLTGPLTSAPAPPASTVPTAKPQNSRQPRHPISTDVMLALGGTFIAPHSSLTAGTEPRTQTATHAIAAVGAFHQQFRPALGYRLTLSYTRPDFQYTYSASNANGSFFNGGEINSRIFEAAGTYVIQGPHHARLTTAADAGGALLAFLPTQNPSASYVYRAAGVLGASADYAITKHWSARATYRAQVFRGPDFRYNGGVVPVTTSLVVSNEPAVGIVYHFGKAVPPPSKP